MTTIYISASSSDWQRANYWASVIRAESGLDLVSTWHDTSAQDWASFDARLSIADQRKVAAQDLLELGRAELLFFLMPPTVPSAGAFTELGWALAYKRTIIVSGPNCADSVFTSLAHARYESDSQAFAAIRRLVLSSTQPMQVVGQVSP